MNDEKRTKFEEDVKVFFPELYEIYLLTKGDVKIWKVLEAMVEMKKQNSFGKIEITYQEGRINFIYETKNKV